MEAKSVDATIHLPEVNEYEHEMDCGVLTVRFIRENDVPPIPGGVIETTMGNDHCPFSVSLTLEIESNGELFDATYTSDALSKICLFLALEDEARGVFSQEPEDVTLEDGSYTMSYIVKSWRKDYPITLYLHPRKYPDGNADIIKLQAENRALQRRLTKMDEEIKELKEETFNVIGIMKNLMFRFWSDDKNTFDLLVPLTKYGNTDFPRSWGALTCESPELWNILIRRYADRMWSDSNCHILAHALNGEYHWPTHYPMMIERLIDLTGRMRRKDIKCKNDKTVIQRIDEHLATQGISESLRAEWRRLREYVVARGFQ